MTDGKGFLGRLGGGDSFARDLVLLALFAAVIGWSFFFTVVKAAPAPSGPGAAAGTEYRGELVVRVSNLPESAWHNIKVGDRMGKSVMVKAVNIREYPMGRKECQVTLKVDGPLQFTMVRYPFPQVNLPLRVGSAVWFETDRYNLIGDTIAKKP